MNVLVKLNKIACTVSRVFVLLALTSITASAGVIYAEPMTAEEVDMGNLITWSTATEQASDYFAIFKSADGIEFEQIGEEQAMGDYNDKKDYRFLDAATGNTKAFYRLLQVDIDGKQSYTHISVVHKENPNNFVVTMMGNTTTDRYFNVVFKSEEAGHMTYRLLNVNEELANAKKAVPPDEKLTQLQTRQKSLEQETMDDPAIVQLRLDVEQSSMQLKNIRLTAAEDLTWALVNSPAFLFNH